MITKSFSHCIIKLLPLNCYKYDIPCRLHILIRNPYFHYLLLNSHFTNIYDKNYV